MRGFDMNQDAWTKIEDVLTYILMLSFVASLFYAMMWGSPFDLPHLAPQAS